MADYQKKNVKKLKAVKPKKKTVAENYKLRAFDESMIDEEIPVKSAEQAKTERRFEKKKQRYLKKEQPKKRIVVSDKTPSELNRSAASLRVLSGTKRLKIIKRVIALSVTLAIIITVLVLHFISPTGLFENITNDFAKIGSGSGFPITLNGGTVYDMKNYNDCIAIVSDTYFEVYNTNSKEIISEQHGFSDPVLSVSHERALIYDRNAKELSVYNLNGKIHSKTMKEEILTAATGYNGTFAVVTDPQKCASKLYVYNKDSEELLTWESDEGMISSVAVSNSGETVAATVIKTSGGAYKSEILIFDLDSGEKRKTLEYTDLVYSIKALSVGYAVCSQNGLYSINEETSEEKKLDSQDILYFSSSDRFGLVSIFGVKGSDNRVQAVIYGKNNDIRFDSELSSVPDLMSISSEYFAYSADNHIYIKNIQSGKNIKVDSSITANKFTIAKDKLVVLNNSVLECIEIEETEDK